MSFATLFAVGTTVQVAQSIGAKNDARAKRAAINGLSSGLIVFTILFITIFSLSGYIPAWLGAELDILPFAISYLKIWTLAIIPMLLGRIASSILRALGNTKVTMLVAFFINILNIIGNFILIYPSRSIALPLTKRQIMSLFSDDPAVIAKGIGVLKIIAFVEPFFNASIVLTGVLRGAVQTKIPLYAALGGMWFVRLISAFIFINVFQLGLKGAWVGMFLDLTFRFFIVFNEYRKKDWLDAKIVVDD